MVSILKPLSTYKLELMLLIPIWFLVYTTYMRPNDNPAIPSAVAAQPSVRMSEPDGNYATQQIQLSSDTRIK